MHRVTKPIVLGVAALFGLGLISAAAANTHGAAVSAVAKAKTQVGEARGDQVSALAKTQGDLKSDEAKADATAAKAARATEKAADKAAKTNRDAHGDAVSMVARSDATAAHTTGAKKVNHGGAVSAVARKQ